MAVTNPKGPKEPAKPLAFLRLPQVKARTGLSRSELYRAISSKTFPTQVKLGARSSAWAEHEVEAWIAARMAEREAAS